jgi:hypothetical protein
VRVRRPAGAQPLRPPAGRLGVGGRELLIELTVRRFSCDHAACAHTTFAKQVPGLTARRGRHTGLAAQHLQAVAMALGGRAGARLVAQLATPVSHTMESDNMDVLVRRLDRYPSGCI